MRSRAAHDGDHQRCTGETGAFEFDLLRGRIGVFGLERRGDSFAGA